MDGFDSVNPLDPTQVAVVSSGDRIPGIPEHLYKATIVLIYGKKYHSALTVYTAAISFLEEMKPITIIN